MGVFSGAVNQMGDEAGPFQGEPMSKIQQIKNPPIEARGFTLEASLCRLGRAERSTVRQ